MTRITFACNGSWGDILPYLRVGVLLQQRGCRVTLVAPSYARERILASGLQFHQTVEASVHDASFWKGIRGLHKAVRNIGSLVVPMFESVVATDPELVVGHPGTPGAKAYAEWAGIPYVGTTLCPMVLMSAYDPPVPVFGGFHALSRHQLSPRMHRALLALCRWSVGGTVEEVYALRRRLGLEKGEHPLYGGQWSKDLNLAMFDPVFGLPQRDWPEATVQTGSVLQAPEHVHPLLEQFIRAGRYIVCGLGSNTMDAYQPFFEVARKAAAAAGVRILVFNGRLGQKPEYLDANTLLVGSASYPMVFAGATAVIQHGGIGTLAATLQAGAMPIVVPFGYDQPDNAERLRRKGLALVVYPSKWNHRSAVEVIASAVAPEVPTPLRQDGAERAAGEILRLASSLPYFDRSINKLTQDLMECALRAGGSMAWPFLRIQRSWSSSESVIPVLDQGVDYMKAARRYFKRAQERKVLNFNLCQFLEDVAESASMVRERLDVLTNEGILRSMRSGL